MDACCTSIAYSAWAEVRRSAITVGCRGPKPPHGRDRCSGPQRDQMVVPAPRRQKRFFGRGHPPRTCIDDRDTSFPLLARILPASSAGAIPLLSSIRPAAARLVAGRCGGPVTHSSNESNTPAPSPGQQTHPKTVGFSFAIDTIPATCRRGTWQQAEPSPLYCMATATMPLPPPRTHGRAGHGSTVRPAVRRRR